MKKTIVTILVLFLLLTIVAVIGCFGDSLSTFLGNIWIGILSNAFFIFLLWGLGELIIEKKRNLYQAFFGIKESKKLRIYLSDIQVNPFGAKGLDGKDLSFTGEAISLLELNVAQVLGKAFNFINPANIELSGFLQNILWSDIKIEYEISRSFLDEQTDCGIVTLGSSAFNPASQFLEVSNISRISLGTYLRQNPSSGLGIQQSGLAGRVIEEKIRIARSGSEIGTVDDGKGTALPRAIISTEPSSYSHTTPTDTQSELENNALFIDRNRAILDTHIGFIERIWDSPNNRFFFYCVGLSSESTAGAVYYLYKNWESLNKKFTNQNNFLFAIRLPTRNFKIAEPIVWERFANTLS